MDEKEKSEFSLEDILKEFGSGTMPPADPEPSAPAEAPVPEEEEQVKIFKAGDPVVPAEPAVLTGDTIRLDSSLISQALGEEKPRPDHGETAVFTPLVEQVMTETAPEAEALEQAQPAQVPPEGAEPFSAGWEPKYDQPMGEYVPPEPIVFRPRSRLRELKKKLVAGPERRYYALLEEGMGKYQVSIFLNLLVVLLSCGAVVLYQMGMVQPERMRLLVFGEIFAMLLSALLGSERLLEGFVAIFKGKFNLDSLLTVTFGACIADGVFCLQQVRVPYCAAFCLAMTFSLWGEYQRRNTELAMMDTMRRATRLNRVAKAPDCYEGKDGFYVTDGEVEDFMDVYDKSSGPEKALGIWSLAALVISTGIGVWAGIRGGAAEGVRVWSAALLAALPCTAFICQSRPMAVLERRLHKLGAVLCGWQGVKTACGRNAILISDNDLLPGGSVKVNGVKFYSQRDPEQTIAYTTALIEASGMGIASLFTQLLESRYGRHHDVENFRFYDNGGIGGEVCSEPVLVGTLSFLQEMGVDLPEGAKVSQAVYAAVDGELCGVFAMAFGKLKGVSAGLGALCSYRKLIPVLITGNFLLSESFIRAKFGANTRRMAFPSQSERQALSQWEPDLEKSVPCALTTQDGIAPVAFAITGARALRGAVNAGTWLHIFASLVGMVMIALLSIVDGGTELMTPGNLVLLQLCWAVPGMLITEWTRRL